MSKSEFMNWLRENFSIGRDTQAIIENILDYVEKLPVEQHDEALLDMLGSGIGLTDGEILRIDLQKDEYFEDDFEEEYEDEDYGPSNPWDAPGMSVSDFIRGVSYF